MGLFERGVKYGGGWLVPELKQASCWLQIPRDEYPGHARGFIHIPQFPPSAGDEPLAGVELQRWRWKMEFLKARF